MAGALRELLDVRPGERLLTALMAIAYFLLLVSYYLLKPARDSLFLTEVSPERLPVVFMVSALVTAPLATAYARAIQRTSLAHLVGATIALLGVSLVVLRALVTTEQIWVYYLLYAWVGVFGGLTTSQFWLLANAVYDAAQAKRVFTVLGLGGILGAFAGGEITNALVRSGRVVTADLLWLSLLTLVLSGAVTLLALSRSRTHSMESGRRREGAGTEPLSRLFRSLLASRHLMLTVAIVTLAVMVGTFIDFQFKTVAYAAHDQAAELTSFLGRFYGRMSLISLAVQALFAARLIRWLGVGGTVLVLPVVLMGGTILMMVGPVYVAARVLRGSELALKHSLDRTARELLFLPVPLSLVKRTKILVDMFVDRWARGLAGLLLLGLTAGLGLGVRQIAAVSGLLIVVWIVLGLMMRREYVESFRRALRRRQLDLGQLRVRLQDTESVELLLGALASGQPREVLYALDMLQAVHDSRLVEAIRPLLDHADPDVRRHAMTALAREGDPEILATAERLSDDPVLEVRREALCLRGEHGRDGLRGVLADELVRPETGRRNAALACLTRHGGEREADLVTAPLVESVLADASAGGTEGRVALAGALGMVKTDDGDRRWNRLLADPDPEVVRAALAGIGRQRNRAFLPRLFDLLEDRRFRPDARAALGAFGVEILPELRAFLDDRERSYPARANIPRILRETPEQSVVDDLLDYLEKGEDVLRRGALGALGRLRARHDGLRFDPTVVEGLIAREAEGFYRLARIGLLLQENGQGEGGDRVRLLEQVLGEARHENLEQVFRLLGLIYSPGDIVNAYQGLVSGKRVLRASAQEFLDNLLRADLKRFVLPLVDRQTRRELSEVGEYLFALGIRDRTDALLSLIRGDRTWLSCCAIAACRAEDPPRVWQAVAEAAASPLRLIAETARWRLAATDDREEPTVLTVLEKMMMLQNVDLFADVPSGHLAALAAIAEEVEKLGGDVVYAENDAPDALYLVLEGHVRLHQGEREIAVADRLTPFGTWALLDEEPRVTTATATEETRLLRIDREDFVDLLADQVQIAQGIIRNVAHRMRALADRVT